MYRFSTGNPASLVLLLGVLLSGFVEAGSTTNDLTRAEPLHEPGDWLALQHDMYLFDINNSNAVLSLTQATTGSRSNVGPDSGHAFEKAPGSVAKATGVTVASPVPSALWILGVSLIGLGAISRRRTQSALSPA